MNITCVIVTFNRLEKLKKCLAAYEEQLYLPTRLIVVDNGSNQETKDYLKEWSSFSCDVDKIILTLDQNYGGSGGFYYGMKKAMELGFDWLWIADDDAYPEKNAFKILEEYISSHDDKVVCSSVYQSNGLCLCHRIRIQKSLLKIKENEIDKKEYDKPFYFNLFSFVGAALSYDVVKKCGLPCKDFFIWYDDTEYSLRVNDLYKIVCVPSIKVHHDVDEATSSSISWKTYYGERNSLVTWKKHGTKLQLFMIVFRRKLSYLKWIFKNKKYVRIRKDAYIDFKKGKMGISEKYKPGTNIFGS